MNIQKILAKVLKANHTILNVTNYVSVNDVANLILATNNSPIMSDEILELDELTNIVQAVNINIGTVNKRTAQSMLEVAKLANEKNLILCLDPVGAGATTFRSKICDQLIKNHCVDVICCNISEFLYIYQNNSTTTGVDANFNDLKLFNDLDKLSKYVQSCAKKLKCTIVVSGPTDIVSNGSDVAYIFNGHSNMSQVTGTGCMLSALITTFASANSKQVFLACVSACVVMGISGEQGVILGQKNNLANASLRTHIIDNINKNILNFPECEAKYEIK